MKILVLTPYLPHRHVGHGGGQAVRDLLRSLARLHDVTAACLVRPGQSALVDDVRALGVAVEPLPFPDRGSRGTDRWRLWCARGSAAFRASGSGYPFYVEKYWSADLSKRLSTVVTQLRPDAIQIEYLQMALYCRDLRLAGANAATPPPRLILNTHELGSLPRERRVDLATNAVTRTAARVEAARWRRLQVAASGWADHTLCVTPQDHSLLAAMGGVRLQTVPLGMDLEATTADWNPAPGNTIFLFVGSFDHRPNRSAARFLLEAVWPEVRATQPTATLELAGRGSLEFLKTLGDAEAFAKRGVTALGYVEDLAPCFRRCTAFAAPMTEGGGIKIKVLEALARGVPVVTTPVGAEGIADEDPGAMMILPPDGSFATGLLKIAADHALARNLACNGRQLMEKRFSWTAIAEKLTRIYAGELD